jgi:hypothetical protein
MLIFDMEVDVAIARPPIPANIRTTFMRIAVEDHPSWSRVENEARNTAALMAHRHGEIVTAVRIVGAEV